MLTQTLRSRFPHEVGEKVEGFTILEKRIIIPPDLVQRKLGVFDYLVEVPPAPMKAKAKTPRKTEAAPERGSYTRSTPDEKGVVIRRVPSR